MDKTTRWRPDFQPDHLYFITTKAHDYAHLFRHDITKRLLVDTLDDFRLRKKLLLFCFVIVPNHIHLIAQFSEAEPMADVMRDYKKHTADRLIRQLKVEGDHDALDGLLVRTSRTDQQSHKVWEDGYLAKDVVSEDFLMQKMNYIHNNPCQPHWHLAEAPEQYVWSSARFYLTNEPCIIPIDDVRKLLA